MGYRVIVASDGTSSISDEWHNAAIGYALTWLCEIGTSRRTIAAVLPRARTRHARTMRVRAALFEAPGAPLVVRTVDLDPPGPDDALVRIDAVGICGSDLHVVKGEWVRPRPMVLGHEGAGVVEAVGSPSTTWPRRPRHPLMGAGLRRVRAVPRRSHHGVPAAARGHRRRARSPTARRACRRTARPSTA